MTKPVPRIDLSAREVHFLDHLAPVWRALPAELRGSVYVADLEVAARARYHGLDRVVIGWPYRGTRLGPILAASYGDLRVCSRTRRPVILFEHGAGQSYSDRHRSYAGGTGRDHVALFIVPNAQAADRNARFYPNTPNAIVGCPKVDELLALEPPAAEPVVAAVSFHWRCDVVPETGTALDDFAPELDRARRTLAAAGVELIGHGHPRILAEASAAYRAAGIAVVDTFAEVAARAHLYAVDNSSTLFEFAALDRPVVVLNARAYRRNVQHGLRFWTEADVGLNAEPGQLADTILAALEDRPEVARSRRAAVARTYPCTDGTSADRAASAIVSMLTRTCIVCGANHASCGGPTDVVPVDQRIKERTRMGNLKRYPNPDYPGSFIKLSDETARRLGLLGSDVAAPARSAPTGDITNPGGAGPVTSTTAAPAPEPALAGVMRPSGVTHRARKEEAMADKVKRIGANTASASDDDDDDEVGVKDKKRQPPSSRRRRVVKDNPQA